MDLLFILVFILLLNTDDNVKVNIPPDQLFTGAFLVFDDGKDQYIVDHHSGRITNEKINKKNYYYYQKCNKQCQKFEARYRDKLFIYFPDNLFKEISQISYIATNTSFNCRNLEFDITAAGNIDQKSLFHKNSCLKNIPGAELLKQAPQKIKGLTSGFD